MRSFDGSLAAFFFGGFSRNYIFGEAVPGLTFRTFPSPFWAFVSAIFADVDGFEFH